VPNIVSIERGQSTGGVVRPSAAIIRVAKLTFLWRKGVSKRPFTLRLNVLICSRFYALILTTIPCIERLLVRETTSTGSGVLFAFPTLDKGESVSHAKNVRAHGNQGTRQSHEEPQPAKTA
jgi:hypothetical protein